MDTQAVADTLVAVLEPVLPSGVAIHRGSNVVVIRDAAHGPGAGLGEEHILVDAVYHFGLAPELEFTTAHERLAAACRVVLDRTQEFVAEATGQPWPGTTSFPEPHAVVAGGEVRCWYGDEARPTLALAPIPLRKVGVAE